MLKVSDYRYGNNEYLYARKSGVLNKLEAVCGKDIRDLVLSYVSNSYAPTLYYWNVFCDDTVPEDTKAQLLSEVDECINYTCTGKSSRAAIDFWNIEMQTVIPDDIKKQPITKLLAWVHITDKCIDVIDKSADESSATEESKFKAAAIYEERGDIKTLITGFYQASTNKFIQASCDGVFPGYINRTNTRTTIAMKHIKHTKYGKILRDNYQLEQSKKSDSKKLYAIAPCYPTSYYIICNLAAEESINLSDLMMKTAIIYKDPFYIQKTNLESVRYYIGEHVLNETRVISVLYKNNNLDIRKTLFRKLFIPNPSPKHRIGYQLFYKYINGNFYLYNEYINNAARNLREDIYYVIDLENTTNKPSPIIEITHTSIEDGQYKNSRAVVYIDGIKYIYNDDHIIKLNKTITLPLCSSHRIIITKNAAGYYDPPVIQRRT
jgi:hypothetical protein